MTRCLGLQDEEETVVFRPEGPKGPEFPFLQGVPRRSAKRHFMALLISMFYRLKHVYDIYIHIYTYTLEVQRLYLAPPK